VRFPCLLELRPSRLLFLFCLLVHALALAGILFSPWAGGWKILLAALLATSLFHTFRQLSRYPARLVLAADGLLSLGFSREPETPRPACLLPPVLALPWLCVFSWREEMTGNTRPARGTLVLLPDSVDAAGLRRLNVWLRFRKADDR
jgi:hypothetical protein